MIAFIIIIGIVAIVGWALAGVTDCKNRELTRENKVYRNDTQYLTTQLVEKQKEIDCLLVKTKELQELIERIKHRTLLQRIASFFD